MLEAIITALLIMAGGEWLDSTRCPDSHEAFKGCPFDEEMDWSKEARYEDDEGNPDRAGIPVSRSRQ